MSKWTKLRGPVGDDAGDVNVGMTKLFSNWSRSS
jgi:hypothetical protein